MQPNSAESLRLYDEMRHSISVLLEGLSRISLDDLSGSMSAFHSTSEHLLVLKHNQRSLGILGMQLTEHLSQVRTRTEQQMQELHSINYRTSNRDTSFRQRACSTSTAHLLTVARQELDLESHTDLSTINKFLQDHSYTNLDFDFTDAKNHSQNMNKLHAEIKNRSNLVEQLEKLSANKKDLLLRLSRLSTHRQNLQRYLSEIEKATVPVKSCFVTSTEDAMKID